MTTPNHARPFGRADALLDRVLGGHWVLQVVVLYAFARIITTVMMAIVAPSQAPAAMTDGEAVGYIGCGTASGTKSSRPRATRARCRATRVATHGKTRGRSIPSSPSWLGPSWRSRA